MYVLGFWLFLENFEVMKLALHGRGVSHIFKEKMVRSHGM